MGDDSLKKDKTAGEKKKLSFQISAKPRDTRKPQKRKTARYSAGHGEKRGHTYQKKKKKKKID